MNKHLFFITTLLFGLCLQAQSLVGVNVDDLSDAQVYSIFERSKAEGLTVENVQEMAINNGMSPNEALKFKIRLDSLLNPEVDNQVNPIIKSSTDITESQSQKKYDKQKTNSSNIFGHDYFNIDLGSFDKSNEAKAPSHYILGFGDELTISIFGSSYFQQTFQVSESGILNLGPKFGSLKIRGMPFKNVEKLLRARFKRGFDLSKNTFDLSLSYGRNISINIVGEVENPGTYSISALNNAFHALAAAGGPTKIGSIRDVQVYRAGDIIETIDFYKFFLNPEGFKISFLQDGDFLIVPAVTNLVLTSGSFKREMNFEILPNETVQNLVDLSGGFLVNSYDKKIKIFRNTGQEKLIMDIESKDFSSTNLNDGDSVYANFKYADIDKYVNISGAFAQPGNYGYTNEMTLGDLISLSGGIKGRFPDKEVILSRLQADGSYKIVRIPLDDKISSFKLQISDYVYLSSREQDLDDLTIKVIGSINNPGVFKYSAGMTLDDALKISGGLLLKSDNERVEITRKTTKVNNLGNLEVVNSSIFTSVDSLMKGSWDQVYRKSNVLLKPYDIINVREIKNYELRKSIHISGEVEFPGTYPILKTDEKISDVIKRSGGISEIGDAFNSRIIRKNDSNLVSRLDLALSKDRFNYIIEPGDSIHVPKKSDLVFINGNGQKRYDYMKEIFFGVPFKEGQNAGKIIKKFALGFSTNADKRNLSVSYPNGKYDRTKNILFFRIYPIVKPGGYINIYKKTVKEKVKKIESHWIGTS